MRENDIDFQSDELGCELGEAFAMSLRPAIFDRDIASFDPAEFAQSLQKSSGQLALRRGRSRAQEPDDRQLARLLRSHRERPRCCQATNRFDELSPSHMAAIVRAHANRIQNTGIAPWHCGRWAGNSKSAFGAFECPSPVKNGGANGVTLGPLYLRHRKSPAPSRTYA